MKTTLAAITIVTASMLEFAASGQGVIDAGTTQVSSLGHTFRPGGASGGPVARDFFIDQQQGSGGGGMIGSVSANFDVNNQFSLTISALPGQKFLIHVPTPGTVRFGGSLAWSSLDGYYPYYSGSVSATFLGLEGVAPTFSGGASQIAQNHLGFGFTFLNSSYLTGDIAFTSITLTGTALSANMGSGTLDYSPSGIGQNVFYAEFHPSQSSDPGQFVSIVPEPNCTVVFVLGIFSLVVFGRCPARVGAQVTS